MTTDTDLSFIITIISSFSSIVYAFFVVIYKRGDELFFVFPTAVKGNPLLTAVAPGRELLNTVHKENGFYLLDNLAGNGVNPMGDVTPAFRSQNHSFIPDFCAFSKRMPRFYHVDVTTVVVCMLVIPLFVEGGIT